MSYQGPERRSSLSVSGPYGLRVVLVGGWSILWALVGLIAGLGACLWAR